MVFAPVYLASGPFVPYPKRHFCNSMQASELCQKVLASLKAELIFKADAGTMGSTFLSAGSRNETFSRVCAGAFPSAVMLC